MLAQKQTWDGHVQGFDTAGDYSGHVGLGIKCSKAAATAVWGPIMLAKLPIVPDQNGNGGTRLASHTMSHAKWQAMVALCRWVLFYRGTITSLLLCPCSGCWWPVLMAATHELCCYPGQLHQWHLWCYLQDLLITDRWHLKRECIHHVSLSGIHWLFLWKPIPESPLKGLKLQLWLLHMIFILDK